MNYKQCSDHMQSAGNSGTKVTGLTPKIESAASPAPAGTNPSGSSQGMNRGKEHTRSGGKAANQ